VKEVRLGSPGELADQVVAQLAQLAQPELPLPSEVEVRALVDATFYASLHEEEARLAEFSVAWQPAARGCVQVIAIEPPLEATPKNLAKLAPATRREATSIAVRRDGDKLVAWALLEHGTARQSVIVRVLGPGVLRVDYAGTPRVLYARGEIFVDGDVMSPAQVLTRTFAAWSSAEVDPTGGLRPPPRRVDRGSGVGASTPDRFASLIDPRAAVLARVAARTLDHRHGGMILIVPADVAAPVGVRVHYGVDAGADVLAERFADVIRDIAPPDRLARLRGSRPRGIDGRVYVRDEAQIAFAEAIELVARLTAIDNAVLVDTDLRVRGFGVQVLEGDTPQMTFEHADPYTGSRHVDDLSTFKGTRHPAGVIFCMRQEREAAAIISSQDGQLSLAIKDARGRVEVVGSYERAFGWS